MFFLDFSHMDRGLPFNSLQSYMCAISQFTQRNADQIYKHIYQQNLHHYDQNFKAFVNTVGWYECIRFEPHQLHP